MRAVQWLCDSVNDAADDDADDVKLTGKLSLTPQLSVSSSPSDDVSSHAALVCTLANSNC